MQFHFLDRWPTNPGVAPAGPTIIPSPGICTWHCAPFQSIASQLQIEPSLSAPQKCKGLAKNFSFASWQMLNFVSRGHWRDNVGRIFLPNSAVLCSVVACGTQLGYFQYPAPVMQAASFASSSLQDDDFFSIHLLQCLVASITQRPAASPGILLTGSFVEEWLQWTHPLALLGVDFQQILPVQHHRDFSTIQWTAAMPSPTWSGSQPWGWGMGALAWMFYLTLAGAAAPYNCYSYTL